MLQDLVMESFCPKTQTWTRKACSTMQDGLLLLPRFGLLPQTATNLQPIFRDAMLCLSAHVIKCSICRRRDSYKATEAVSLGW